jgi:hypothetical protein
MPWQWREWLTFELYARVRDVGLPTIFVSGNDVTLNPSEFLLRLSFTSPGCLTAECRSQR